MKNVFDFINDIGYDKRYRFDESTKSKYESFLVNRAFSQHADSIFFANEMNKLACLDKRLQHDFYFHALDAKKRYGKWAKATKSDDEVLDLIKREYKVNHIHAQQYLELMDKNDIIKLKKKYDVGGISK
jgi:hypothetical protein